MEEGRATHSAPKVGRRVERAGLNILVEEGPVERSWPYYSLWRGDLEARKKGKGREGKGSATHGVVSSLPVPMSNPVSFSPTSLAGSPTVGSANGT